MDGVVKVTVVPSTLPLARVFTGSGPTDKVPLASSPLIDAGDFASLHRQAAGLAGGGWITVIKPDGEQMMSTLVPFGTPLPRAKGMDVIRAAVETRRLAVSNLYVGAAARRPIVSVSVR